MTVFLRGESGTVSNTNGDNLVLTPPARYPGDILVLAVISGTPNGTALNVNTSEIASVTPEMADTQAAVDGTTRFRLFTLVVTGDNSDGDITIVRRAGMDTGSDIIFAAKAYVIAGAGAVASSTARGPFTAANGQLPSADVNSANSLVTRFYLASSATGLTSMAQGFKLTSNAFVTEGLGADFALFTLTAGSDVNATASTATAAPVLSEYAFVSLVFTPASAPPISAKTPVALLQLGCAESYEAFLMVSDPDTRNLSVVDAVGFDSMTWERTLDEVSTATVDIPDRYGGVRCCAAYGGLVPWKFWLRIERNAQKVWEGPITQVSRPTTALGESLPQLRLTAQDVLVRFQKRLAVRTFIPASNIDAGTLLKKILTQSQYTDLKINGFYFPFPVVLAGSSLSREVVPRGFEYAWDVMKDLFDAAVDAYVMNGVLYVWYPGHGWAYNDGTGDLIFEGPTDPASKELVYGLFTEGSWRERPGWDINGMSQANFAWEPGADSGEEGARRYWTAFDQASIDEVGQLDYVDPNPLYRAVADDVKIADAAYQRRADSLIAQRGAVPAIISGGSLAEDAPIDVDNLRPGGVWMIDINDYCYGQLLTVGRLKRVSVDVGFNEDGALTETVSPTILPIGYTDGDF